MIPLAHIAGMPVEETIASLGPALLLTFGAASATLRARLRDASAEDARPDHVVTRDELERSKTLEAGARCRRSWRP